jgi:hypothetical protein
MTQAEYLQVLTGFERRLRRHADAWGNLLPTPEAQAMREAWERTAAAFHADFPDAKLPAPFWEKKAEAAEEP